MAVLFSQSKIRGTSEKNIQTSEIKSGVPRIKNDALTSYISKEADKTFLKDMLLKFAPVTKTHHRTAMYRLSNLMAMEPFKIFVTQLLLDKNISNDAKASFISHANISSDYMYQVLLNI
ncbi:MAG: hypothetical protein MI799_11295, partial [Desulfobacterales bacterium]|nr:hypothetical protein [Desulfobacterales bacterium]